MKIASWALLFVVFLLVSPSIAGLAQAVLSTQDFATAIKIPGPVNKVSEYGQQFDEEDGDEETLLQEMMAQGFIHRNNDFNVMLKARHFVPTKGISAALKAKINKITAVDPTKRTHVLMQFERIPSLEEREGLKREGVELLAYIPNNAWYVSLPAEKTTQVAIEPLVRAMDVIKPEYKISPYIQDGKIGDWAIDENGNVAVIATFHKDAQLNEAAEFIETMYGVVHNQIELLNALIISVPQNKINMLALEDSVQGIEEIPPEYTPLLNNARAAINVNPLHYAPYNLDGTGIMTFVYDVGLGDITHADFGGRVTREGAGTTQDHPSHVAGIIGGDGNLSSGVYRGMAQNVDIYSRSLSTTWTYNYTDDITNHYSAAISSQIDVANNSWGYQPAANDSSLCNRDGDYTIVENLFDQFISGILGKRLPIVFASGNERGYTDANGTPNCGNYNTITTPSTAKNVITVGANNSNDDSMTGFSSWGPVDDGRIKPEIVAPGCQIGDDGAITSTVPDAFINLKPRDCDGTGDDYCYPYAGMCGTSMAAPMVTGSIALMLQQWRRQYATDPLPSTMKALLIHTAKDLGNAGPDYQHGYGRIDVNKAVNAIIKEQFIEASIDEQFEIDRYYLTVPPGTREMKVTLVWDDPPALPFASRTLVNNLNLFLIDANGYIRCPWFMDPQNPSQPATVGCGDAINNVEQFYVQDANGLTPGTWEIRVVAQVLADPPQPYSLVSEYLAPPEGCVDTETQITTNTGTQWTPAIYGNKIVWGDSKSGGWDIYMYNLDTSMETRITTNTASQQWPAIYADKIVYTDNRNGNYDIYMYNLSTSTETQITTNTAGQTNSAIYADKIVWIDNRNGNYDIYMYNLSTSTETRITTNTAWQLYPAIYGNRIVWDDNRNGNKDIYMYNIDTNTETRITTNTAGQQNPAIYGNRIVYWDTVTRDIYMYNIDTNTETRITTSTADHQIPAIYGNRIVWQDYRNGNWDIYTYNLSTSTETRITTNTAGQYDPAIYGDRIVWYDYRNGNYDIYTTTVSSTCNQLPIAMITAPADGATVVPGTNVTFVGNASDAEDGSLAGTSLVWASSIDGQIGTGETFSTTALSVGTHTIALTASDSQGGIGNKFITIIVSCVAIEERRITTNTVEQQYSAIYGNRIVWMDYRNGNWDIYMYNLDTNTERRITTNTADQQIPAIDGNRIVWEDNRNGTRDVYMYKLDTNTESRITTNTADQYAPAIYGNRIVYGDNRNGTYDIYMYNITTFTESRITTNTANQQNPASYGNKIVWEDDRNGYGDIYMYNLDTNTESSITTNTAEQYAPAIYGNKIVWWDNRNGNGDIYMYNLDTNTESSITTNTETQLTPQIYANKIVWWDNRNGNWDIYMYNLDMNTERRITTNTADQQIPAIYGNKIVWMDYRNGNADIYMAVFSDLCETGNQPPTISGIPDQNIIEDSGFNNNLVDLWAYASDPEIPDNRLTFAIISETGIGIVDCWVDSSRYIDCSTKINQSGYSDVTVQVSDGNSTAADTFRVNVLAVNDPPSIAGLPNQMLNVNSGTNSNLIDLWVYAFDIETSDENLAFSIVSETGTTVVDCTVSSNRYIDCTVHPGQNGYSDVNVRVSDGELTDTDIFRVTVSVVNGPPVISFSPLADPTITEGQQQLFEISATDPDGDAMGVNWYVGAQYVGSGWSYTYVADYNTAGKRYVTAVVSDGNYSVPKEWLLTVVKACEVPYDGFVIDRNVTLCPGIYNLADANGNGAIVIDSNSVTLDCNGTVVYGNGAGKGIVVGGYIPAEWYVDGNTGKDLNIVKVAGDEAGFESSITYRQGITIRNCDVSGYAVGLAVVGGSGLTIANNGLHDNAGAGLGAQGLMDSTIAGNFAYNNGQGGIAVQAGKNNAIEWNDASFNTGTGIASAGRGDIISSNNASNNSGGIGVLGYDYKVLNNAVAGNIGNEAAGISALYTELDDNYNSTGIEIAYNDVSGSANCIDLIDVNNVYLHDNNMQNCGTGLLARGLFQEGAVWMESSRFENNRITNNSTAGMHLTNWSFFLKGNFGMLGNGITGNYFENPGAWDLLVSLRRGTGYVANSISGNSFMGLGVNDTYAQNTYCVGGVGNTYGAGAQQAPGDCPS